MFLPCKMCTFCENAYVCMFYYKQVYYFLLPQLLLCLDLELILGGWCVGLRIFDQRVRRDRRLPLYSCQRQLRLWRLHLRWSNTLFCSCLEAASGGSDRDVLARGKCLQALAALRHTKWFQVCVQISHTRAHMYVSSAPRCL